MEREEKYEVVVKWMFFILWAIVMCFVGWSLRGVNLARTFNLKWCLVVGLIPIVASILMLAGDSAAEAETMRGKKVGWWLREFGWAGLLVGLMGMMNYHLLPGIMVSGFSAIVYLFATITPDYSWWEVDVEPAEKYARRRRVETGGKLCILLVLTAVLLVINIPKVL